MTMCQRMSHCTPQPPTILAARSVHNAARRETAAVVMDRILAFPHRLGQAGYNDSSMKVRLHMLLVAGLTAAGCGSDYQATASQKAPSGPEPREVRLVPATQEALARTTVVTGTLAAEEQIPVSMKVAGRLNELLVDLGSRVQRGQAIARLDPTDFRLRVQQAEA